jgi:hypothetical protein
VSAGAYFIYFLDAGENRQRKKAKAAAKGISGIFPHVPKKILTAYPQAGLSNLHSSGGVQLVSKNKLSY